MISLTAIWYSARLLRRAIVYALLYSDEIKMHLNFQKLQLALLMLTKGVMQKSKVFKIKCEQMFRLGLLFMFIYPTA